MADSQSPETFQQRVEATKKNIHKFLGKKGAFLFLWDALDIAIFCVWVALYYPHVDEVDGDSFLIISGLVVIFGCLLLLKGFIEIGGLGLLRDWMGPTVCSWCSWCCLNCCSLAMLCALVCGAVLFYLHVWWPVSMKLCIPGHVMKAAQAAGQAASQAAGQVNEFVPVSEAWHAAVNATGQAAGQATDYLSHRFATKAEPFNQSRDALMSATTAMSNSSSAVITTTLMQITTTLMQMDAQEECQEMAGFLFVSFRVDDCALILIGLYWAVMFIVLSNDLINVFLSSSSEGTSENAGAASKDRAGAASKAMARHILAEILFDLTQMAVQGWTESQVLLGENHFRYKLVIDFLNIATTAADLAILKGPAFVLRLTDQNDCRKVLQEELEILMAVDAEGQADDSGPQGEAAKPDEEKTEAATPESEDEKKPPSNSSAGPSDVEAWPGSEQVDVFGASETVGAKKEH